MAMSMCFQACMRQENVSVDKICSIHIINAFHTELNQLTGVAAILNFPVPDIDEEDE